VILIILNKIQTRLPSLYPTYTLNSISLPPWSYLSLFSFRCRLLSEGDGTTPITALSPPPVHNQEESEDYAEE